MVRIRTPKKLLTTLVAGALAPMIAPTIATADITIYGQTNAALESIDDGVSSAAAINSNGSRFGVKGSADMGDGIKGVFLLEATADGLDSSNNLFGNGRDAYAGISGNFGTIGLGHHGQPYKTSTNQLDVFADTIADYTSIMNGGNVGGLDLDSGIANSIIYFSPNVGGFGAHVQIGLDETDNSPDDTAKFGGQVHFGTDRFYVTGAIATDESAAVGDVTAVKVGGSISFGSGVVTTLGLIAESIDSDTRPELTRSDVYFSANIQIRKTAIKIAVGIAGESDVAGAKDGAVFTAVGASHMLTKNTQVYGLIAVTANDTGGTFGLGRSGSTGAINAVVGQDATAFSFGIKHSFELTGR